MSLLWSTTNINKCSHRCFVQICLTSSKMSFHTCSVSFVQLSLFYTYDEQETPWCFTNVSLAIYLLLSLTMIVFIKIWVIPLNQIRVAELGSLSSEAKMAMQIFVKRGITIFATNALFLCVIANLQLYLIKICHIYHVIVHFLPKKHCFWPKKALFLPKDLQKVRKSRQILIRDKIAYVRA